MSQPETVSLTIRVPETLKQRLKILAIKRRTTLEQLVVEHLESLGRREVSL